MPIDYDKRFWKIDKAYNEIFPKFELFLYNTFQYKQIISDSIIFQESSTVAKHSFVKCSLLNIANSNIFAKIDSYAAIIFDTKSISRFEYCWSKPFCPWIWKIPFHSHVVEHVHN